MLAVMLSLKKYFHISCWKIVISAIVLTISGLTGAKLMFWIESGNTGGVSFFGALFFAPLIMIILAWILKISVGEMLDLCAPAECIMLALLKVKCVIDRCCMGRLIRVSENLQLPFPSQIVELITALIVLLILKKIIKKGTYKNQIYACYMIFYGVTRFFLNLLRDTTPFVWILPAGNFWAIIATAIGCVWIFLCKKQKR